MKRTTWRRHRSTIALAAVLGLVLSACGTDTEPETDEVAAETDEVAAEATEDDDRIQVVATTSIMGDIVSALVGDEGDVEVLMDAGVDPHAYEASAADAAAMREADLVVAFGLMLEEGLVDALDAAAEDGVNVVELAEQLDPIDFDFDGGGHDHGGHDDHGDDDHGHDDGDDHGHDDHGDDDHGHGHDDGDDHGHDDGDDHGHDDHGDDDHGHGHDEDDDHGHDDHGDDHGHDHGDEDPHVWFDPIRMADGVMILAEEFAALDTAIDEAEWMERGEAYAAELLATHDEMEEMFASIPDGNRQLITNHDALGYLAERYDFTVLGTVIPGSSTQAEADPRTFAELIETVEEAGVDVVFAENTDSTVLAEQLASEVVGRTDVQIEVVRIYTDALGEEGSGAETYVGLLRTTAELIADALS